MDINTLFPSKYLKGEDLGGREVTVTIKEMKIEKLGAGPDKEDKPVLYFERATKSLILNRTNALVIADLYGPETSAWRGKRVTLYSERLRAFGKTHDAIRVKATHPAETPKAAPPPAPELALADDPEDMLDLDEAGVVEGVIDAEQDCSAADSDFAAMWEQLTPPKQNLLLIADRVFGPDWEMASPWLVRRWTKLVYPDHVARSEAELSDDQRDELVDYIKVNEDALRVTWPAQKANMLQPQPELTK
jgi:hypothetical protein